MSGSVSVSSCRAINFPVRPCSSILCCPSPAAAVTKLPPGRYSVIWHVTSVDTHKTEGQFSFSISP